MDLNGKLETEKYRIVVSITFVKYNGKRVVIIDDINDTGTTLKGIHEIVVNEDMAKNVKYITLFDKLI